MTPNGAIDRVAERRRAVALARHYRDAEGLSIAQIADRLGRSPATVKAYFYDPTGDKAKAVKARCQGVCRCCGAYTQPRDGKRRRLRVLQLRREALCRIPGAAGRNSKGCSWVQWLTRIRKVKGTIACQESGGHARCLG
jgi:AraC-like DNA-binding protein